MISSDMEKWRVNHKPFLYGLVLLLGEHRCIVLTASKHGFCMTVTVGQQGVYIKLSLYTFRDSWKQFITSYKLINSGFCLAFSWCRVSSHLPTIFQTDKKICIAFPIKAPCLPCQQCSVSLGLNQLEDFSGI